MIWKNFVSRLAITSRRRGLATAIVYGLSLAVRFTSATGEEVEIPPQSAQRRTPADFHHDQRWRPSFPTRLEPERRRADRLSPRLAAGFGSAPHASCAAP